MSRSLRNPLVLSARRWLAALGLPLLLCLALVWPAGAANYQDPAYQAAVADALVATPAEISRDLTAIVGWNPDLIWEGRPGASRVKMVSFTGAYYDKSVGQDYVLGFGYLWVTAAPKLQEFFASQAFPSVTRLEQLLGLPLETGYTRMVEFWVDPADLFRPSPDPEITDMEAELDFPSGSQTTVSQSYKDWFSANFESSFHTDQPYPWTRLGYTYDWGRANHVGLSEFVVEKGASVGVAGVYQPLEYLMQGRH